MTVLIIIAAVITLICLVRVGVSASFEDGRLCISARIWKKNIIILPREKAKKEKPPKDEKPSSKPPLKLPDFSFDDYISIARTALKALDRLRRRLVFDKLSFVFVSGSDDPYTTVTRYSAVCAAVNSLSPWFESVFKVKERDIRICTDFDSEKTVLGFDFSLSIRIGGLLGLALLAAFSMLKVYVRSVLRQKGRAANGQQAQ